MDRRQVRQIILGMANSRGIQSNNPIIGCLLVFSVYVMELVYELFGA